VVIGTLILNIVTAVKQPLLHEEYGREKVNQDGSPIYALNYSNSHLIRLSNTLQVEDFLILFTCTYPRDFILSALMYLSRKSLSGHELKHINVLEKVKKHFTKRILSLSNLSFAERLAALDLDSLQLSILKSDLVLSERCNTVI